jgi:hypothetical protein
MPDCCLEHVSETRLFVAGLPGRQIWFTVVMEAGMDLLVERPGALDVHKESVTAKACGCRRFASSRQPCGACSPCTIG